MSRFYSSNEGSSTSVVSSGKVIKSRQQALREEEQGTGSADLDVLQQVLERKLELDRGTPSLSSASPSASSSRSRTPSSSSSSSSSSSKLSMHDELERASPRLWGHRDDDDGKQYAAQPLARSSTSAQQATDCDNDSDSGSDSSEDDTYNYDYHEFYSSRSSSPNLQIQNAYSNSQLELHNHLTDYDLDSHSHSVGVEERRDFGSALDLQFGASAAANDDNHVLGATNINPIIRAVASSPSAPERSAEPSAAPVPTQPNTDININNDNNHLSSNPNPNHPKAPRRPPHGFAYYSAYVSARRLQGASNAAASAALASTSLGRSGMTAGSAPTSKRDFSMYGSGKGTETTTSSHPRRPTVKRKPVPVTTLPAAQASHVGRTQVLDNAQELADEKENANGDENDGGNGNGNDTRFSKYSPSVLTFNAGWSPITNDSLFWEAIGIDIPVMSPTSTSPKEAGQRSSERRGDDTMGQDLGLDLDSDSGPVSDTHGRTSSNSQDQHQIKTAITTATSTSIPASVHHDSSRGASRNSRALGGSNKGGLGIDTSPSLLSAHTHTHHHGEENASTCSPSVTAVSSELDPEFSHARMVELSRNRQIPTHSHLRSYSNTTTLPSYSPLDARRRGAVCEESRFSDTDTDGDVGEDEDEDADAEENDEGEMTDADTESTIALDELIEHHSRTGSPEHESNDDAYDASYASSSAPSRPDSPSIAPSRTRTRTETTTSPSQRTSSYSTSQYSDLGLEDGEAYPNSPPPPFSTRPPTQMVPKVPQLPQTLTNVLEDPLGKLAQRSRLSRYVMLSEARGTFGTQQQQQSIAAAARSVLSGSGSEMRSSRRSNSNSQKPQASAAPFDISCLYACDEQLLLAPMDSFADLCWEDATGGEAVRDGGDDRYGKGYAHSQDDEYEDGQSEVIPSFDDAVSGYDSVVEVRFRHSDDEEDFGSVISKPLPRLADVHNDEKQKLGSDLIANIQSPPPSRPAISHIRLPFSGKKSHLVIQNPSYPHSPPPIPSTPPHRHKYYQQQQYHHQHSPSQDSTRSSVPKTSVDVNADVIGGGNPSPSPGGRRQQSSSPNTQAQPHLTLNVRGLKRMASIFTPTRRQAIHEQLALATHT